MYLGNNCINELTWRHIAEPCKQIFATVKPTIYGGNTSNTNTTHSNDILPKITFAYN